MPPWFADPMVNHFANDRTLTESELHTLTAWVAVGSPAGNPKDAPSPRNFEEGWQIGKPDLIKEMAQDFDVPASGVLEYQYIVIPLGFTEDKWVQAVEVRPGNRAVVHHATAVLRAADSNWLRDVPPGVARSKRAAGMEPLSLTMSSGSLAAYTPGQPATQYAPGRAVLIKAGSDLVLEMHYTANGTAAKDKTKVGFIFARQPPVEQVARFDAVNTGFAIPPGDPNYSVEAAVTLKSDVKLVALHPHMHLRGKSAEFRVVMPNGERITLLRVPQYDFNWQLRYQLAKELFLTKGTRLEVTCVFDNSPNNPSNPDPTKTVRWGDQQWDEMALGGFEVVVPQGAETHGLITRRSSQSF